ncbi:MAG: hypothetical protein ACLQVL_27460 [Terriglobia bacterium]
MAHAETPHQATQKLLELAVERFGDLREAERKRLSAALKADWAVCGPSGDFDDATNDPAKADDWGPKREVRAALIR